MNPTTMTRAGMGLFAAGLLVAIAAAAPEPSWHGLQADTEPLASVLQGKSFTVGELEGATEAEAKALRNQLLPILGAHAGPAPTEGATLVVQGTVRGEGDARTVTLTVGETTASAKLSSTWPRTVPLFAVAAVVSAAGVGVWRAGLRRAIAAEAKEAARRPDEDGNPFRLLQDLLGPARALSSEIDQLNEHETMTRVDALLVEYVLPFAEVRAKVTDQLGMAKGAEILVTIAYGERMLNRTWSAASDEHLPEARRSYPEALAAFEEAAVLVDRATGAA